jgi:hypothetical protein
MIQLLAQVAIPILRDKFPERGLRLDPNARAFAVFPAIHPEVGDIEICDDGDELTVMVGNFTHYHLGNHDEGIDDQERQRRIIKTLVEFLDELFSDQVEMYGSHATGGGFGRRGHRSGKHGWMLLSRRTYVWSGPLS